MAILRKWLILFRDLYVSTCLPGLSILVFYTLLFLVDSSPHLASHFFFSAKISSFIRRGISFQILGCMFIPKLCIALWKPLHCCVFLASCNMSVDKHSRVLWEMWVQICNFQALNLFLLHCSVLQNQKPALGANHHHLSWFLYDIYQNKLSTSHFTFYGKIVLWPISYAGKMFTAKMLAAKVLTVKIPKNNGHA